MLRRCLPLAFLGLICTACPNPNTFTTPRTVPVGKVEHTISIETIGGFANGESVVLPVPPSYTARIGVADRMELGLHFSHMSSLGADFKWNPLRTEAFDLAIDPGAQAFYIAGDTSAFIYYLHAPLLLGFNLGSMTTIVLTPGVTLGGGAASTTGNNATLNGSASGSTLFGRLGLGFDFRFTKGFSMQPEVTFLKAFESGGGTVMLAGFGFKFGAQPEYGGSEGGGT